MRANKGNYMRAINDVLMCDDTEAPFITRLCHAIYDGIFNLRAYMSKTMRNRIFDIANAITTAIIYKLYWVSGGENEQHAVAYLSQFKCLRVLYNNLYNCLSIHDLPDEVLNKVKTTGKPLFNFINKYY